jgi:hypothetical protein
LGCHRHPNRGAGLTLRHFTLDMRIFELFWVVCYLGFLVLSLLGIFTSLRWFQQLERAHPAVFDLSGHLVSKPQRLFKYWRYVLDEGYLDLDDPQSRAKCRLLKIFFWIYLADAAVSVTGIFIVWHAMHLSHSVIF